MRLGLGSRRKPRGTIRCWICREHTCQIVTFIEQNLSVCVLRVRLGVRAIRQLRFEGATRDSTTRDHVEHRVAPHQAAPAA